MNKYIVVFIAILAVVFLTGATTTTTTKKRPAQTGTYTVDKHKSSGKKGVGGICFIDSSQY
jgi:hypothetical protein